MRKVILENFVKIMSCRIKDNLHLWIENVVNLINSLEDQNEFSKEVKVR